MSSQTWYLAAVEETETFDELFFRSWTSFFPVTAGQPDLPLVSGKKSPTLEKKVHHWFHSSTGQIMS